MRRLTSAKLSVCGAGGASLVFNVPEVEVGAMVARDAVRASRYSADLPTARMRDARC